jgi:hypothetical protein
MMMRPTVATITPASATEGSPAVFEFSLSNPSAVAVDYTFTFTNGTAGSADYTTTSQTVTVPAGATTGTVSVPTTADTIAESMRPLLLPLERLRLLEQSMIMMRLNCSHDHCSSATEVLLCLNSA